MRITIVGSDPASLALAMLLARMHTVTVLSSVAQHVEFINACQPPLDEPFARAYQQAHRTLLHLKATHNAPLALRDAALTIVGEAVQAPSSLTPSERLERNSAQAHRIIADSLPLNPGAWFVLQGLVPQGTTATLRKTLGTPNIIFAPFMGGPSPTLYSTLHPSRIVVGACTGLAHVYAQLLRSQLSDAATPILMTGSQEAEAIGLLREPPHGAPPCSLPQAIEHARRHGLATRDLIEGLQLHDSLPVLLNTPIPAHSLSALSDLNSQAHAPAPARSHTPNATTVRQRLRLRFKRQGR